MRALPMRGVLCAGGWRQREVAMADGGDDGDGDVWLWVAIGVVCGGLLSAGLLASVVVWLLQLM